MSKIVQIGTVHAQGYVIRRARVNIVSESDIEDPQSQVKIELRADIAWVGSGEMNWVHDKDTRVQLDIDNEKFLIDNEEVKIINGKEIMNKVIIVLAGLIK